MKLFAGTKPKADAPSRLKARSAQRSRPTSTCPRSWDAATANAAGHEVFGTNEAKSSRIGSQPAVAGRTEPTMRARRLVGQGRSVSKCHGLVRGAESVRDASRVSSTNLWHPSVATPRGSTEDHERPTAMNIFKREQTQNGSGRTESRGFEANEPNGEQGCSVRAPRKMNDWTAAPNWNSKPNSAQYR